MRINGVSDEYQMFSNTESMVGMILMILINMYDTHDTHDMVRMCAEY